MCLRAPGRQAWGSLLSTAVRALIRLRPRTPGERVGQSEGRAPGVAQGNAIVVRSRSLRVHERTTLPKSSSGPGTRARAHAQRQQSERQQTCFWMPSSCRARRRNAGMPPVCCASALHHSRASQLARLSARQRAADRFARQRCAAFCRAAYHTAGHTKRLRLRLSWSTRRPTGRQAQVRDDNGREQGWQA